MKVKEWKTSPAVIKKQWLAIPPLCQGSKWFSLESCTSSFSCALCWQGQGKTKQLHVLWTATEVKWLAKLKQGVCHLRSPKSCPSSSLLCVHASRGWGNAKEAADAQNFWFLAQPSTDPLYWTRWGLRVVKFPLWFATLNLSLNLTHLASQQHQPGFQSADEKIFQSTNPILQALF